MLTPFVIGAVLAYALHPLVERLDALGAARAAPAGGGVVELLLILVVVSLVLIVVPILAKELPLLREQLPLVDELNATLAPWLAQLGISLARHRQHQGAAGEVPERQLRGWPSAPCSRRAVGGSVVLIVVGYAVLVPVVLFYLLLDWPQVVERALELVPPRPAPAWTRSPPNATSCSASTCAASCW